MTRTDYETALRTEITAIRRIVAALESLDEAARKRTLTWLVDRYAPKDGGESE